MSKDIVFARLLGIAREPDSKRMQLALGEQVQNHVGSMHASAQFALAEVGSGDFLRQQFPALQDKVLAVVRRAEIKYSKPVESTLQAFAHIEAHEQARFERQLERKRRAQIAVQVTLKTESGDVATRAVYHWFVTKL